MIARPAKQGVIVDSFGATTAGLLEEDGWMDGARRYLVSGLVQGVGYRYFALQRAQDRGLVGYVKNLYNGHVEVVAEGAEESLDALRGDLLVGPRFSKVSSVDVSPIDPTGSYTSFSMVR